MIDPEVERRLSEGEVVRVRAASHSMSPTIKQGESVFVRSGTAKWGDVILIRGRNDYTLHRLIGELSALGKTRMVHCGDAAFALPGLCNSKDVLGVADLPCRPLSLPRKTALLLLAAALSVVDRLR